MLSAKNFLRVFSQLQPEQVIPETHPHPELKATFKEIQTAILIPLLPDQNTNWVRRNPDCRLPVGLMEQVHPNEL